MSINNLKYVLLTRIAMPHSGMLSVLDTKPACLPNEKIAFIYRSYTRLLIDLILFTELLQI